MRPTPPPLLTGMAPSDQELPERLVFQVASRDAQTKGILAARDVRHKLVLQFRWGRGVHGRP